MTRQLNSIDRMRISETLRFQFPSLPKFDFGKYNITANHSRKTGRIKEVFLDSNLILVLRTNDGRLIPTLKGAEFLMDLGLQENRVKVNHEVEPFIRSGKSLYCKYIVGVQEGISPGDIIFLINEENNLIALGISAQSSKGLNELTYGVGVKVKSYFEQ